jgi:glucose-1-phosphate adenylyltransferase
VLILSGDHIYKMDYSLMLDRHKKANAACTISVMEVPMADAPRFGIMNVDESDMIYEFEEKPKRPKSNLASMGIYIFTWSKLRQYLIADEADEKSSNDFGKNVIPAMLAAGEAMAAYRFQGYWRDVGTIDSLWDANMDLLSEGSDFDLYDPDWTIYARTAVRPPQFIGPSATLIHSIATSGDEIYGTVEHSALFHSVTVEEGATVRYSILMPGVVVKSGAVVEYAIVAENSVIGENAHVGSAPDENGEHSIAVVAQDLTVGKGAAVQAGAMVTKNVKGVKA